MLLRRENAESSQCVGSLDPTASARPSAAVNQCDTLFHLGWILHFFPSSFLSASLLLFLPHQLCHIFSDDSGPSVAAIRPLLFFFLFPPFAASSTA